MKHDITFHPSWWNQKAGIRFTEEFFCDPLCRIESDIKMRQQLFNSFGAWGLGTDKPRPRPILGSDLIASGYLYSQILGCDIRFSEAAPPEVICPRISEQEALSFQAPDLGESPHWQKIEKQIQWLRGRFGRVQAAVNLQGVLNLALDLRGDNIFIDMYQNPGAARNLFTQCFNLSVAAGKRLREVSEFVSGGVTAITNQLDAAGLYVHSNCSVEMISLENYRDFLMEYDIKLSETFKPYGIHHCGQTMEHVAGGYAEAADLYFAEAGAGSDIARVRSALPDCHLNLRYSPVRLATVSGQEMKEEIREMIQDAGSPPEKLSVSCVGIDTTVSEEQIRLFLNILKDI